MWRYRQLSPKRKREFGAKDGTGLLYGVAQTKALQGRPREDEAGKLMERLLTFRKLNKVGACAATWRRGRRSWPRAWPAVC